MKRVLFIVVLLAILVMAAAPITVTASQDTPVKLSAVALAQGQGGGSPELTLSSEDISFTPQEPGVGDTVTITATIYNVGGGTAKDVLVYFYANSASIGTDGIKVIPKGQSRSAEINWIPDVAGNYTILVVVDSSQASKTIYVSEAAPPPPVVHDVAVTSVIPSATEVPAGEVVTITVVVENQGTETENFDVTSYYDSAEIGTQTVTGLVADTSETLTFDWDTTGLEGPYTIKAEAILANDEDPDDNTLTDGTVTVTAPGPPPTATHVLFIEIDYIEGHKPTQTVLDYIEEYYMGENPSGELINVTFYVDEEISYESAYASISYAEFWDLEAEYNDVKEFDDRLTGMGRGEYVSGEGLYVYNATPFYLKEKWVLYGTADQGGSLGYCWVMQEGRIKLDFIAGNYMFVADETADNWATTYLGEGKEFGAEAVVLMHEMGHSIGIGEAHLFRGEIYCNNQECVMSLLSTANADNYGAWFYCDDHWAQKNLEYYTK